MIAKIDCGEPKAEDEGRQNPEQSLGVTVSVKPDDEGDRHMHAGENIPADACEVHEIHFAIE
jgi:hypothetical protein